ncbi:hypothetical protein ES703_73468 [subsurface metagenome]
MQGDTGPTTISGYGLYDNNHGGTFIGIEEENPEWVWIKLNILNALYLPGFTDSELVEFGSPVNTFRVIFNHYFNTNYEILPDKYYFMESMAYPSRFMDVTDALNKYSENLK